MEDHEDKSVGGVTWHATEEDGGPDVGISVYLGPADRLWLGEISRALFDECRGAEHFDGDGGWFIVRYNPNPTLIAKCAHPQDAREFVEQIAWLCREAGAPTVAKTLGAVHAGT